MRELRELQTGQAAFISGLMSDFSLPIAALIFSLLWTLWQHINVISFAIGKLS